MRKLLDLVERLEHRQYLSANPNSPAERPVLVFDGDEIAQFTFKLRGVPAQAFTGYSYLSGRIQTMFTWNAGSNLAGPSYNNVTQSDSISKVGTFSTNYANTVVGGADLVASFQQAITAGSSATINLASLIGILQAAITPARIKSCQIRLLSAADDSLLSPAPTSTSTVTVTNIGPAVPHPLYFGNGGSGLTVALTVGATIVTAVAIGAAGTGYPKSSAFFASPQQVGGSGCIFGVVTNGSGVPTSVVFNAGAGGTGYTAATVPTVPVGQFNLTTGNAQANIDVTAAGLVITSTAKNFNLLNMDGSNAITVELNFFLGSN